MKYQYKEKLLINQKANIQIDNTLLQKLRNIIITQKNQNIRPSNFRCL